MNLYSKIKNFFNTLTANALQYIKEDGSDTVVLQSMFAPDKLQFMRQKLDMKTKSISIISKNSHEVAPHLK